MSPKAQHGTERFVRVALASSARIVATSLVALFALSACGGTKNDATRKTATAGAVTLPGAGAAAVRDEAAVKRWLLPSSLAEVSGLALTADERLFAHDDKHGRVTEIDYQSGKIVKEFSLGPDAVKADFEGITVANGVIYMLASDGVLYRFAEGGDSARVPYTTIDTELGDDCEFEGVAFDPAISSLLLACKIVRARNQRDSLVIYRWKLADGLSRAERLSRLTVPVASVIGTRDWKTIHPSDITIDPRSGNYLLVASKDKAVIEITPKGAVVSVQLLPGDHPQPEGIALTKDRILIVSDEAVGGPAVITSYRWP